MTSLLYIFWPEIPQSYVVFGYKHYLTYHVRNVHLYHFNEYQILIFLLTSDIHPTWCDVYSVVEFSLYKMAGSDLTVFFRPCLGYYHLICGVNNKRECKCCIYIITFSDFYILNDICSIHLLTHNFALLLVSFSIGCSSTNKDSEICQFLYLSTPSLPQSDFHSLVLTYFSFSLPFDSQFLFLQFILSFSIVLYIRSPIKYRYSRLGKGMVS